MTKPTRDMIFKLINGERDRQDQLWGYPQNNTFCEWSSILAEETGELVKELNDLNFTCARGSKERVLTEAIQVAAVAVSIIEHFDHADRVTSVIRNSFSRFDRRGMNK